jgi:membrane protein YdbS with pleckstrin-like domain
MSRRVEEATAWVYRGIWGVLTRWFRVPSGPPPLPGNSDEGSRSFRPADGFLRYLKLKFWFVLVIVDVAIFAGWLALFVLRPKLAVWLAPVAFVIAVVPDVFAYIAIHLRYDTTWYVFTSRSLRIRRGIWVIHESTITFENIQNVAVNSGPLERYFGIANVTVDTAGGGQPHKEKSGHHAANYHQGLIEGIDNANEIRSQILARVRRSRVAGLGDEAGSTAGWSHAHVTLLREIRDLISGL